MSPIKILSQKPILSADLFSVIETKLDIKGIIHTHRNIYRPPIASVFPLSNENEIYLIKQYRYLHDEIFLEEVAGHVDKDESVLQAAKRELKEESGMSAKTWKKFGVFSGNSSVIKSEIHLFLARGLTQGNPAPEEDEDITLVKIPLGEAVKHVISGDIKNSVASLGILLLFSMQKEGKL